jgi:hypothetical protein
MQTNNKSEVVDFQQIALTKATDIGRTIYVTCNDGSYLYLTFDDDFSWDDVVYVAKV